MRRTRALVRIAAADPLMADHEVGGVVAGSGDGGWGGRERHGSRTRQSHQHPDSHQHSPCDDSPPAAAARSNVEPDGAFVKRPRTLDLNLARRSVWASVFGGTLKPKPD